MRLLEMGFKLETTTCMRCTGCFMTISTATWITYLRYARPESDCVRVQLPFGGSFDVERPADRACTLRRTLGS